MAFTDEAILTFQDVVDIARAGSARSGRVIGVAPELKHPSYFASIGLPMERPFLEALNANGLTRADSPIVIQCFEVDTLRSLRQNTQACLLQLMSATGGPADHPELTFAAMATLEGLAEIATYADAIGVETTMIVPRDAAGRSAGPTSLVSDSHAAGLKVVAWTFRAEAAFLPVDFQGDLAGWIRRFFDLGVDGIFADFPAVAIAVRDGR